MERLTPLESRVCAVIQERRDELIVLASTLIGFDTTAREPGDAPKDEAALQQFLAGRLEDRGMEIDLWEPSEAELAGNPLVPPGLDFRGRPQMIARRPGMGTGRSLTLNGHIDVVSAEPRDLWASDPFVADVREGCLFGRGACDMKGGIAAMTIAAEALVDLKFPLGGDLVVATNTDEESSGAGGAALIERGLRTDAAIVTEPTGLDIWVACRGSEYCVISVPGRPGHAEVKQPPWQEGGAVNAIEKAANVLDAIRSLRTKWSAAQDLSHPYLSSPDAVPTLISAGEWAVTYPAACEMTVAIMYLPAQADASGWGGDVRAEFEAWIAHEAEADDWLAVNPPKVIWQPTGNMPLEIAQSELIVSTVIGASRAVGAPGRVGGLDSWYDGATLSLAGIPALGFGPPGLSQDGVSVAHTIDEFVPVDGLVQCAQALAVAAIRFCGTLD